MKWGLHREKRNENQHKENKVEVDNHDVCTIKLQQYAITHKPKKMKLAKEQK